MSDKVGQRPWLGDGYYWYTTEPAAQGKEGLSWILVSVFLSTAKDVEYGDSWKVDDMTGTFVPIRPPEQHDQ